MKKVITYGTFDLLHYGHIRLLERAKELGDYLIVGVTSDDFDKQRGKINVEQSLMERIKSVKQTGLADEIIIEEYEGQKIDDIRNYGVDIFTVGSDWKGKFDYLKNYCDVVYLDRTKGISSTDLRNKKQLKKLGAIGMPQLINKYYNEINYVNGIEMTHICCKNDLSLYPNDINLVDNYDEMLNNVDAVYICDKTEHNYELIKKAIDKGKHVLFEPPLALNVHDSEELYDYAIEKRVVLMEAMKTNYSQAYRRLILLAKSGAIGQIISVDSICTSLRQLEEIGEEELVKNQSSICAWGPTALLPIFQLLGTNYRTKQINTICSEYKDNFDLFSDINFIYDTAVARAKIGKGIKSESELIISGTKGYIYVPSPWWKTDYFEVRYENQENNKRYFYSLEGEGIRYELVNFNKAISDKIVNTEYEKNISLSSVSIIEDYYKNKNVYKLHR